MRQLYSFQQKAAAWLAPKKRAVLGSSMGTGKSAVAITAAMSIMQNYQDYSPPTIIICPATLKFTWKFEIESWLEDQVVQVIDSGKDDLELTSDWLIFSYELYQKFQHELLGLTDLIFIVDEAHMLANLRTNRTKAILGKNGLPSRANRTWLLSGTPLPDRVIGVYPIFNFCLRGGLGKYQDFIARYSYVRETPWGPKPVGHRNMPELVEKVRPVLYRDKLEDVLPELPDSQEVLVYLEETPISFIANGKLEEYKDEIIRSIHEGRKPYPDDPTKRATISVLRRELAIAKVGEALTFIKGLLEQEQQVVVFAHHRNVVAELQDVLSKMPKVGDEGAYWRCETISGETPALNRANTVKKFQNGELDVVVLSIHAASLGITLTKSHVAVFVELPWSAIILQQAKRRLLRIGQRQFTIYNILLYRSGVDHLVLKALQEKEKTITAFWDSYDNKVTTEEPVIDWDQT